LVKFNGPGPIVDAQVRRHGVKALRNVFHFAGHNFLLCYLWLVLLGQQRISVAARSRVLVRIQGLNQNTILTLSLPDLFAALDIFERIFRNSVESPSLLTSP